MGAKKPIAEASARSVGHTAGPWEFSADGIWAISPWNARVKIATITFFSDWNGIDAKANGRLIETTPTILRSLEAMVAEFGDPEQGGCTCGTCLVVKEARAALSKAKGGA